MEDESIENESDVYGLTPGFLYRVHRGERVVNTEGRYERNRAIGNLEPKLSILA